MAILKIVPGGYMNRDALDRLIQGYIFPKSLQTGGCGVDPNHAAEQMRIVKRYWNQDHGKQLHHFVLCLNASESAQIRSIQDLVIGAYQICHYYSDYYQVIFGIHRPYSSDRWHIHFVVNNTSYMTGERLPEGNIQDYRLRDIVVATCLPIDRIRICHD